MLEIKKPKKRKERNLSHSFRLFQLKILRIKASPYEVAMGFAIGAFIGIVPTVGVAMVLSYLFARVLKVSKIASVLGTWMNNPWSMAVIYPIAYKMGQKLLNTKPLEFSMKKFTSFNYFVENAWNAYVPLFIGSIPFAIFIAVGSYYIVYDLVATYQKARRKRILANLTEPEDYEKVLKEEIKHEIIEELKKEIKGNILNDKR